MCCTGMQQVLLDTLEMNPSGSFVRSITFRNVRLSFFAFQDTFETIYS